MRFAKSVGLAVLVATIVVAAEGSAQTPPTRIAFRVPFPKPALGTPGGEAIFADLGLSGGRKSIVFGTTAKKLYVHDFDGTVAPGWPKDLPGEVRSSPDVADFGLGHGTTDIVVRFGGGNDSGTVGGVAAFQRDGTPI